MNRMNLDKRRQRKAERRRKVWDIIGAIIGTVAIYMLICMGFAIGY